MEGNPFGHSTTLSKIKHSALPILCRSRLFIRFHPLHSRNANPPSPDPRNPVLRMGYLLLHTRPRRHRPLELAHEFGHGALCPPKMDQQCSGFGYAFIFVGVFSFLEDNAWGIIIRRRIIWTETSPSYPH